MKKNIEMLVLGLLFSVSAAAQDIDDYEVINIENEAVQAYMADSTYESEGDSVKWNTVVYDYSKNEEVYGTELDWPAGKLVTWTPTTADENIREIRITVNNTDRSEGEVGHEATHNPDSIGARSFVIRNLLPGCIYTYKVDEILKTGEVNLLDSGAFRTEGQVRMIQVRNAHNMRDIGGWKSQFGGTVRYGILYRSGSLGTMNKLGRHDLKDNLNIRAELDLRKIKLKDSRLGKDAAFRLVSHHAGTKGLTRDKRIYAADLRWILGLIMPEKYGKNKKAKPVAVDWHCAMGCDRCGAVSFLIEGLLGMSRVDICRDFELSSFKSGYNRPRSHLGGMFKTIGTFGPSDDLARCFYNYWLSLGLKKQELDDFINHMIQFDDENCHVVSGTVALQKP